MIQPGFEKQHLSGEASFRSFVPISLQEAVRGDERQEERWISHDRIREGADRLSLLIERMNQKWEELGPDQQREAEERMLRREVEQSVLMAYPVKPEACADSGSGFFGAGTENCGSVEEQGMPLDLSMLQDLSMPQSVCFSQKHYTLEDIPDEFRSMAELDCQYLYHAAKEGVALLDRIPISGRLLKEIHYIALYGPHYDKLYRGEFRNSPVWIGLPDGSLSSAEFVPPVYEAMIDAFSEMEKFIHYEEEPDPLVKAALLHYQFETIHPFLDGNGRLGRLFTQLFLREFCGLSLPWIPLSGTLIQGMDRYYKELRLVQTTGDYFRWTCWFTGVLKDALESALNEL